MGHACGGLHIGSAFTRAQATLFVTLGPTATCKCRPLVSAVNVPVVVVAVTRGELYSLPSFRRG